MWVAKDQERGQPWTELPKEKELEVTACLLQPSHLTYAISSTKITCFTWNQTMKTEQRIQGVWLMTSVSAIFPQHHLRTMGRIWINENHGPWCKEKGVSPVSRVESRNSKESWEVVLEREADLVSKGFEHQTKEVRWLFCLQWNALNSLSRVHFFMKEEFWRLRGILERRCAESNREDRDWGQRKVGGG